MRKSVIRNKMSLIKVVSGVPIHMAVSVEYLEIGDIIMTPCGLLYVVNDIGPIITFVPLLEKKQIGMRYR